MCDAGRIRHHLKYNLWRPECTVLFVGYQSPGTLGNALVNGAQEVKLFGEPVQVGARIAQLGGLSGHADKDGLEAWLRAFDEKPKFVFVNHGEDAVAEHWANHLKEEGYEADAPYNGSILDRRRGPRRLRRGRQHPEDHQDEIRRDRAHQRGL